MDALNVYNDLRFRDKAARIGEKLKTLDKNSEEYKDTLLQYNAYVENIGTKELVPQLMS